MAVKSTGSSRRVPVPAGSGVSSPRAPRTPNPSPVVGVTRGLLPDHRDDEHGRAERSVRRHADAMKIYGGDATNNGKDD
jgi:hypothetical protein